jgi:hypothetical protein
MSFILRAAFWLTVLAFLLPAVGYEIAPKGNASAQAGGMQSATLNADDLTAEPQSDISATEALGLAAKSAKDAMGFCDRNPDVCERGGAIASHVIQQSAYYGSRLFLWLTDKARATSEKHEQGLENSEGPAEEEGIGPKPRPRGTAA